MSVVLVDYLIARNGLPPRQGLAYDYVLAGDGLYLVAQNRYLDVRVPVARAQVRGLVPLYPSCTLLTGLFPQILWEEIVQVARVGSREGHEVLLTVIHDAEVGYRLSLPWQCTTPLQVVYRPGLDVVLEIHSHHRYPAHFSAIDDADEQGLRLYGVLGRLDTDQPEVALRVGAYGSFLPLPWDAVFSGDRGSFRDVYAHSSYERGDDDELPD